MTNHASSVKARPRVSGMKKPGPLVKGTGLVGRETAA